jgi:hypothetical protein
VTVSQGHAVESAQKYLAMSAFSRSGLIQQLSSKYGEGYPRADALYAVDHVSVNWNEQARSGLYPFAHVLDDCEHRRVPGSPRPPAGAA